MKKTTLVHGIGIYKILSKRTAEKHGTCKYKEKKTTSKLIKSKITLS